VDGVFDLREALVLPRKNWAANQPALTDLNTPCPIEFSVEEMEEHERQLENFRCYEAAVDGIYSALHCEGDGWVAHENYDIVRKLIGSGQPRGDMG
jgi:hypothetical protein